MKNIEEQIKVMKHYANGGEVEIKNARYPKTDFELLHKNGHTFNFMDFDYRIKEEKKTIIIEKWIIFIEEENEYKIIETSNIDSYNTTAYKRIKLLESYEVEV